MCEYVQSNKCSITNSVCPYMYFCHTKQEYKPLSSMPDNCKIKLRNNVPKGYRRVLFERRGDLYIELDDQTIVVANPFEDIPDFVKVTKTKDNKWRLRK